MKALLFVLVLAGVLCAEEGGLAGVWSTRGAMAEPLECMCGHDTQLVISKVGESALEKDHPLILKRVPSEPFFKELSGMRANEFSITRSSRLFPTYLPSPFGKEAEAGAPEAKEPAKE